MRMFYTQVCVCGYARRLTITHNDFHNGRRATEGSLPTVVEAAKGRLHYG